MTALKPQKEAHKEAMVALATLGGRTTSEDDIVFRGKEFVIPETMKDLKHAIKFLEEKEAEEEKDFVFNRKFTFRPMDGAVATGNAIRRAFGATVGRSIVTMFGERPPELIDVEVNLDEHVQAPWGALAIPGLDGLTIYLGEDMDSELGPVFQLFGEGPRKYRFHVEGLFRLVERELRENSIYRGKAINGKTTPGFIDLSGVDPANVVYSDLVLRQLETSAWSPIVHAEALEKLGESGKRAVLLEGPYGTGKTLAAYLTAQIAVKNGWTFLMARPGRDNLEHVIQTARMYQPAVVFFEDLDTMASTGDGQGVDHMSRVLDMFDGLDTKGLKMLLVLTTNRVESLHPGMLRPGRLDAVISIGSLDRGGVERLSRQILGQNLEADVDFDRVFTSVDGYTPAFVREVLGRARLYSISRNNGEMGQIGTADLVDAADGLRPQLLLHEQASADKAPESMDDRIAGIVRQAATVHGVELVQSLDDARAKFLLRQPS